MFLFPILFTYLVYEQLLPIIGYLDPICIKLNYFYILFVIPRLGRCILVS